jgi:heat shock protein HslJ
MRSAREIATKELIKMRRKMKVYKLLSIAALIAHGLITACGTISGGMPAESGQNSAQQALTENDLANAIYRIDSVGEFRLVKGEFKHQYGEGSTQIHKVVLEKVAIGDLDDDGLDDAAVILAVQSGGSGTFRYLIAMRNTGHLPDQRDSLFLGDHVQTRLFSIADGQVRLEMLQPNPGNPVCRPGRQVKQTYKLHNGKWGLMTNQVTDLSIPLDSEAKITGIVWKWERYDDTFHSSHFLIDDPSKYTLIFLPNGTYQVKADCNRMQGQYTRKGAAINIVPGAATLAECGPESHYSEYLRDLTEAISFEVRDNKLVLNLVMGGESLVFGNGGPVSDKSRY